MVHAKESFCHTRALEAFLSESLRPATRITESELYRFVRSADHQRVETLKRAMIAAAASAGGVPPTGYDRLEDCFTHEPDLGVLLLWYNVEGTTRVEVRHVTPNTYRAAVSL